MIKVFTMFSGYGGAEFALKKANIDFVSVGYSEIDKNAIKCYNMNHFNIRNYGDCTKIDPNDLDDFDLLCAGFPCQAFSSAGKRKGFDDTRGTLFKDIVRIAEIKKPTYMILENVKGLINHDEGRTFQIILRELKRIGYDVRYKVLNSKDFGIPQNRERIIIMCKFGVWDMFEFQFPNKINLTLKLKDLLEDDVSKKYYLSSKMINGIMNSNFRERQPININSECKTLKVGGDIPCFITHSLYPRSSKTGKGGSGHLFKEDNTAYCLDTGNNQAIQEGDILRRLTPIECFRLMGFKDNEIILDGLSDTAKYKLAGNGWDINLFSLIFKNLFKYKSFT